MFKFNFFISSLFKGLIDDWFNKSCNCPEVPQLKFPNFLDILNEAIFPDELSPPLPLFISKMVFLYFKLNLESSGVSAVIIFTTPPIASEPWSDEPGPLIISILSILLTSI